MELMPNAKAIEADYETGGHLLQFGVVHQRHKTIWFPPCPSLVPLDADGPLLDWVQKTRLCRKQMAQYLKQASPLPHPRWDDLYPFQQRGVRFILATTLSNPGTGIRALLGDDPRLGKTVQALVAADLTTLQDSNPKILIVCLNSLKQYWADVIENEGWFSRSLPITVLEGSRQKRMSQMIQFHSGFLIVHWEALRQFPGLTNRNWTWLIGDEAHKVKNRRTQTAKALWKIPAKHKLFLSATFAEKGVHDYWSVLHALNPRKYSSYYIFQDWFTSWVDFGGYPQFVGSKNTVLFRELVADTLMARKEKNVELQLPPVIEKVVRVPLKNKQAMWYERVKKEILIELASGEELEIPNAVARTVRLRQAALSTHFFDLANPQAAKVEALVELVQEEFGGRRFVVYSIFRDGVDLVVEALRAKDITVAKAYGGAIGGIAKWKRDSNIQGLVATPQIGGVGLNLSEADYLIYLDLPWSSILYKQSFERPRAVGKQGHIQVIYMLAQDSIDELILKALRAKNARLNQLDLIQLILRQFSEIKVGT